MSLKNLATFKPFAFRDFNFLYLSEICFYIPIWMAGMVFGLITTHIKGNSPFYVGLIGLGFNLPMLLGPFIGVIVDYSPRSKILKIISLTSMIAAVLMALLLIPGWPNFWLMFLLVLIYGVSNAFYYPAMVTAATDYVPDQAIVGNAISLVNTTNRIMMFFGYGIGGFLVSYFNEATTFWLNAILLLLSFVALTKIRTQIKLPEKNISALAEMKAGFTYLKSTPPVLNIIIILALMGFFVWPYLFQMPIVNRYYFNGTAGTLGILLAVGGIGGTVGAFLLSLRKISLYLNHIFITGTLLLAISLILLAACRSVFWGMADLFLLDFCLMVTLTVGIIFIQIIVPKEFQGRIMGIVSMVSFGTIPLGSTIFYGGIGEPFGVMTAFFIAGLVFIAAIIYYLKQLTKIQAFAAPIFVEKSLLNSLEEKNKI